MIRIDNIKQTVFDSVPVDSFWNTGEAKELKMHRIHAYPAKFPAFITTKAEATFFAPTTNTKTPWHIKNNRVDYSRVQNRRNKMDAAKQLNPPCLATQLLRTYCPQ